MDNIDKIAFVWLGDILVRVDQIQALVPDFSFANERSWVYLKGKDSPLQSGLPIVQAADAIAKVNRK